MLNEYAINRQQLASDDILDDAFHDLCKRYKYRGDHHDIWHLRFHWPAQKQKIQSKLLAGHYRLSQVEMKRAHQQTIQVWSAEDTLVLNALGMLMRQCLKENGLIKFRHHAMAGKKLGQVIRAGNKEYNFQVRIQLQDFYASVNHKVLMAILQKIIKDSWVINLLQQYLHHLQDDAGQLKFCRQGLYKGSRLAPLLAGLYLQELDNLFESQVKRLTQNSTENLPDGSMEYTPENSNEKSGPVYFRWRDEYVYFCHEQHHFNSILTNMNNLLGELDLKIDQSKSQIGPCEVKEQSSNKQTDKEQSLNKQAIKEQTHVAG